MDLQQNDNKTLHTDRALPLHTVLSQHYELMRHVRSNDEWIVYHAKEIGTDKEIRIAEFLPKEIAERSIEGNRIAAANEKEFAARKKELMTHAKSLISAEIPHLYIPVSFFEENETVYLVFPFTESTTLAQSEIPITAGYLQSLAITLCDTYSALHSCGFCYGRITENEILLHSDGSFRLSAADHLKKISDESDVPQDLYMLVSFLSDLFMIADSENKSETQPSPYAVMKNVLQYRYHSAQELRTALTAADGTLYRRKGAVSSKRSLFRTMLCIFCLLVAAAVPVMAVIKGLPLGTCMKLGLVHPDVISVWMPISDSSDEQELLSMYRRLTAGFEKKYEGFGIDLVIYADDSFSDALRFEENKTDSPTVFMNTQHDTVKSMACDLSALTRSLSNEYHTDMSRFKNSIPLGCTLPALYYHVDSSEKMDARTIEMSEVNPTICYDAGLADYIQIMDKNGLRKESTFSVFMESRSDRPFLATTECLAVAEKNALTSGSVCMIPVSVNHKFPLLYEMHCSVNEEKDWNSRCIGMLWIQYLLTEEAQQIMFAENYSVLPVHRDVLQQTLDNHQALSVISEIQSDFRTTPLN